MSNYFYFKSLNDEQEKEVTKILEFATPKLADSVINNIYPFIFSKSNLSVYDSSSEEILYSYDRVTDSVIHISAVKKPTVSVRFADSKKGITIIRSDGKKYKDYKIDPTNKDSLNSVYLDLNRTATNPSWKFSLFVNGKPLDGFSNLPLSEITSKFKSKIDDIILEASKEDKSKYGSSNENGVNIQTVNKCITQLSEKLKANGLFTCEEFNSLVLNLKQGKISEQDFTKNCDQLIQDFKNRNNEYNTLLAELKNSDEYKAFASDEELNKKLDSLNLRKKFVYDKSTADEIKQEFFTTIANYTLNKAKEKGIDVSKNQMDLIYNYLKQKNIITSVDSEGNPEFNLNDFSKKIIDQIKDYIKYFKSFEDFKSKVESLLDLNSKKKQESISKMNKWIEQNFKFTKLPEQLAKVKAEVEKGFMTYEEFLEAYYSWAKNKYYPSKEETQNSAESAKNNYLLYFSLFQDTDMKKPLVLKSYNKYVSEFDKSGIAKSAVEETLKQSNALLIKGNENSVITNFNKKIKDIYNGLESKYGNKYHIRGIMIKLQDKNIDNSVVKAFKDADNIMSILEDINKYLKEVINSLVDEDKTEDTSEIEVLEDTD